MIVLTTKNSRVEEHTVRLLDFRLKRVEIFFEDIRSQKVHDTFVDIAKDVIRGELESDKNVVISVAGGRKTISVGLYKAGIELGVRNIS